MTSTAFEKKGIPAPNVYKNGRGKEMFDKIKGGTSTVHYGPKDVEVENIRITKIKKNEKPGPASFKVAESLEACKLRRPVNQKLDQAKNVNFVDRILK